MSVEIGTHLRIGWDYMSAQPATVTGSVLGWYSREFPWGMKSGVVLRIDSTLHSTGTRLTSNSTPDVEDEKCEGDFLILLPRYRGQGWDKDEGTVQVELHSSNPLVSDLPGHWIASHGVYRVIDGGEDV
jgi:hypothetical protein